MATTSITSSGTGSGMDFESIISASVEAKKTQLENKTTKQKNLAQIELDGVNSLKSALKTFRSSCKTLLEDNSMNTHKVTTSQATDENVFTVKTQSDTVNTNFDLKVKQLAKSEAVTKSVSKEDINNNSFSAGTITIDLGDETYKEDGVEKTRSRTFTVDVQEGDSLELIRKRINQNDYGVNVNLIQTTSGYTMSIDSGTTGSGGDNSTSLNITTSTTGNGTNASLDFFNYSNEASTEDGAVDNGWTYRQAKNALIEIDGNEVSSTTNKFDEQISGLSITVNKLSDTETITSTDADGKVTTTTGLKSYNVDISSDTDVAYNRMQEFISAYNTMMSSMDDLYKHNTYTDGSNNYDGGDLAGDSQLKAIQNTLTNMLVKFTGENNGKSIFECGLEYKTDGTLELDKDKFTKALDESFTSVTSLFTDENGLIDKLYDYLDDYTKTSGILDDRIDELNQTISSWTDKENANATLLEKYEEALRTKYGNLDSLMSSYNTSLSYISSILG